MRTQSPLRIHALRELIQDFLRGLPALGLRPVRAVLYGSYAKGHPHGDSDVDLAVWLEEEPTVKELESPRILRHRSLYYPVSPKYFVAGETADDDPFIGEILSTGQEILLPETANPAHQLIN